MLKLSSIISAVKPRDRTDQYKILSALYCLNAHATPVTTSEISNLLKLHFPRKDLPKNITASLRQYTACVAPVDKGRQWKWQLTQGGLDRLRSLSGLALLSPPAAADFGVDVGIVCALEHPELSAVTDALGGESNWKEINDAKYPHVYRETELPVVGGRRLRIVSTSATSMGLTAAAIATTHLVFIFRPRLVAMVGIAAGTKSGDKQFGDVLVGDPSVDYSSGKVVSLNGARRFQPDPYPIGINARLRAVLKTYSGAHPSFAAIRGKWKGALPPNANRLHLGPLGAADQVIDEASRLVEIQEHWRKLIGVEMESYAVYRACAEAPEPKPRFVSFKSVCDFAAEKSDSWQGYAAFTAAEFAVQFLTAEWQTLWTNL
jgi:nucleoside phosphorylase